ncbi:MAG: hypothetical protein CSA45_05950 [Gammaproteobacteria bacterium]|nr:MAG: hypothetical protein CSA45_05950 [Gammaproteobacteria bacterium]
MNRLILLCCASAIFTLFKFATAADRAVAAKQWQNIQNIIKQDALANQISTGKAFDPGSGVKLTPFDGEANHQFGFAVSLDGDRLAVGSSIKQGVYIFAYNGANWIQEQKITVSDSSDSFGRAVSLDGERLLVGARTAEINGNTAQGAAYVFEYNGTNWVERQKLTASDGAQGDIFADSVALDGDRLLIGATGADINANYSNEGAAYVFEYNGTKWVETQKLSATDGRQGDEFGLAVALDGDRLMVGADLADANGNGSRGAVYVFDYRGSIWTETQKLTASDGAVYDMFGRSVALDGDCLLIGAAFAAIDGNRNQGAAYVFAHDGSNWVERQKLIASDGEEKDYFGASVAIDGDHLLVGAYGANINVTSYQGAAYVFAHDGSNWVERQKFTATDGAEKDYFGGSVALENGHLVIGAYGVDNNGNDNQGAVYVYQNTATGVIFNDSFEG